MESKEFVDVLSHELSALMGADHVTRTPGGIAMSGKIGDLVDQAIFCNVYESLINTAARTYADSVGWWKPVDGPAYDEFYRELNGQQQSELDEAINEVYDRPFACSIETSRENGDPAFLVKMEITDEDFEKQIFRWKSRQEMMKGDLKIAAFRFMDDLKSPDAFQV